jgi:uncharacterized protein
MPVNFSIKNVPDELAEALRLRARQNHRSLQGELLAMLESSLGLPGRPAQQARETARAWGQSERLPDAPPAPRTISDLFEEIKRHGFETPAESAAFIRQMRDERDGRQLTPAKTDGALLSKPGEPRIEIPHERIAEFCRKWRIVELSLFGSVLRHDFRPDSDVDILVRFEDAAPWSLMDFGEMQEELERILGRAVDLVEKDAVENSENPFRRRHILAPPWVIYAALPPQIEALLPPVPSADDEGQST